MPRKDKEETRKYQAEYYQKHKEERQAAKKEYYQQNAETIKEQRRERYKQNSEETITQQVSYNKAHTKLYTFRSMNTTDADIIAYLDSLENKAGYIKELIRADILKHKEEEQTT